MCERNNYTQVSLRDGRAVDVDSCLAPLVQALNDSGFETVACCCGHGKLPGNIVLKGDRWLIIVDGHEEATNIFSAWHSRKRTWFEVIDNFRFFFNQLRDLYETEDEIWTFLCSPNKLLDEQSPIRLILEGRDDPVCTLIDRIDAGAYL